MQAIAGQAASVDRTRAIGAGRAGRAWEFLELLPGLIEANAQDNEARFLGASIATGLGLGTLARELIDQLAPAAKAHPGVSALSARAQSLPEDRWPTETRAALVRANLRAIETSGCGSGDWHLASVERWQESLGGAAFFRARDGNIVRRYGEQWLMRDDAGLARLAGERVELEAKPMLPVAMFAQGGAHLLARVLEQSKPDPTGPKRLIVLVARDGDELIDALSVVDLTPLLSYAQLVAFAGEEACERLGAWLSTRREYLQPRELLCAAPGGDEAFMARARGVLALEHGAQVSQMDECRARINERYGLREAAWWRARYAQARTQGPALRVMVVTTRYSTFIQHSSRDLCAGLEAAGMQARLVIEPDDFSQRCALNVAREIDGFDPDLCVLINYPRTQLGDMVPSNVPFVTWVQDAMPHLFTSNGRPKPGGMDWLIGHLYPELVERWNLPHGRTMLCPVLVSEKKFHPAPVSAELAERFACEVAYVSHHAPTPEQFCEDLAQRSGSVPGLGAIVRGALPMVSEAVAKCGRERIVEAVARIAAELVGPGEALSEKRALVTHTVLNPLVERVIRHEMVGWAAEICARRGWRMKLFGRGWEKHPTLSHLACGELAHGEELRASYQCSAVHLHAGLGMWLHQRVLECALSGGLPLVRRKQDDLVWLGWHMTNRVGMESEPMLCQLGTRWTRTFASAHPMAMRWTAQLQRLGREPEFDVHCHHELRVNPALAGPMHADEVAWLMGDLDQSTFDCRDELEALIVRAVEQPAWRASVAGGIARRAREHLTYQGLAHKVVRMIERSIDAQESTHG
jgi:hypothetical protein